jgi:hypothetical protein
MKRLLLSMVLFLTAFAAWAQNETPMAGSPVQTPVSATPTVSPDAPTQVPTATPVISVTAPKSEWAGRFGLGLSAISVTPREPLSTSADSLPLFSIRYWLSNRFQLDLLLGATAGNQTGTNLLGNTVYDPFWAYCYGVGIKTNLAEPVEGLWIKFTNQYLYFQNSSQSSRALNVLNSQNQTVLANAVYTDQYQYLSVSAGLGFEYFLPFVKNLSLETSETLEFDTNWETYNLSFPAGYSGGGSQNYSTWILKVTSPGFNLTSLTFHYYF